MTRSIVYNPLKHIYDGFSTSDMTKEVMTKYAGRQRLAKLKEFANRLAELISKHETDPTSPLVEMVQCLRIEVKLMGHALIEKDDWLAPGPAGGPSFIPNIAGSGRFLFESELADMLGVNL